MNDVHSTSAFAAERYVLGELTAAERDRFEEHFFSCTECADRVTAAATFMDNARAVLPEMDRSPSPAPKKARNQNLNWFGWSWAPQAALACLVLLAAVTGYQNAVQIPHLRASAPTENDLVLSGAQEATARRAASHLVLSAKNRLSSVVFPDEWEERFPRYVSEIRKEPESPALLTSSPAVASGPLVVRIPTAHLGAGKYTIMLYGVSELGARQPLIQQPFTIQE